MQTMYPAVVNSPTTELASAINASQTTIPVLNASVLPAPPNLATIGTGEDAETILYTGVSGNDLTGVTRGFQGAAKSWSAGVKVARYFTAYDHEAFRQNIEEAQTIADNAAAAAAAAQATADEAKVELVDIRTPASGYTPLNPITTAGGMVRDMQTQFMGAQVYKLTANNGLPKASYSGDMNDLVDPGIYAIGTATNRPIEIFGYCLVLKRLAAHVQQFYYVISSSRTSQNRVFLRTSIDNGATWSVWDEMITSKGGTLTGDLLNSSEGNFILGKTNNTGRTVIRGGQSTSIANGAYIIVEGVDAGGCIRLNVSSVNGVYTVYIGDLRVSFGLGAPEGTVSAPVGSLYLRTDGGASTTLYVKTSGTGNTGWTAK